MNSGDLHKVWEIKVLKKPGDDRARDFLDRIAKQVQPIMRKRRWRVKILSEFWYIEIFGFFGALFVEIVD